MQHLKSFLSVIITAMLISTTGFSIERKAEKPAADPWKKLPQILKNIKPPKFPSRQMSINDFGAKTDGTTDSRPAINSAIEKCSASGGGTVVVPAGTYFVKGPIVFKNNVNLHLEENAVIKFSTDPDDYLPVILTRWEGIECYNYQPLLYAEGQKNIALTGRGTLDGQGSNDNWWAWNGKKEFGWKPGMPSQKDSLNRPFLVKMNNDKIPVEKRIFGKGHYLRPNFLQFIKCSNILIEGVTFLNSPMWFLHPVLSNNITVLNVKTVGLGPNNDGCDPESCRDVLIKNTYFKNGDDCIAIKSGRNNDGRRINVPSENIIIQDCKMLDGHGGVTIGSEISGNCRNVYAENCEMDSPNLDRAIRIKSNTFRGGLLENVYVRNIKVGEVGEAVVRFEMNYEPAEGKNGPWLPVLRNVQITDVTSKKSNRAFFMEGLENSKIYNITVKNCRFDGVKENSVVEYVENFVTENVYINGELYKSAAKTGAADRVIKIGAVNQLNKKITDAAVTIPLSKLKEMNPAFNEKAFVVYDGTKQTAYQTEDTDGDSKPDNIVLLASFAPKEKKIINIESDKTGVLMTGSKKRTHAEISIKKDYKLENGYYTGGRFESVKSVEVPSDHFPHNALYKFEGPGWESDRVAYRFYLDTRNRNDIFGKTVDTMSLCMTGNNDLVSDSKESYTKMQPWGQDIFKVGESLGLGSIGMMVNGKVVTVSKTDNVKCTILEDGPVKSSLLVNYKNWQTGKNSCDLNARISITGGSRLTKEELELTGNPDSICTGIAKHADVKFFKDNGKSDWGYIASYGKQSLEGSSLGLAVFYRKADLINIIEDNNSYIVVLKPEADRVSYYFGAAWEKELNGIKNEKEFVKYINDTVSELSKPIKISY